MKLRHLTYLIFPAVALALWIFSRLSPDWSVEGGSALPSAMEVQGPSAALSGSLGSPAAGALHFSESGGRNQPSGTPPWVTSQIELMADVFENEADQRTRLDILKDVGKRSTAAGQASAGREIVEALSSQIDDESFASEVESLLNGLRMEEKTQKPIDPAIFAKRREASGIQGHLDHLKGELSRAKSQKKPQQDIESLEKAIGGLEAQLSKLQTP